VHVARVEEIRNVYNFLSEDLKGRGHLEDIGIDGSVILWCVLWK
jgi:hypothetical protein